MTNANGFESMGTVVNNQGQDQELGWNDTITADAREFIILPDGDYKFTVAAVEKARFNGSDKMAACNVANISLRVYTDLVPQGFVIIKHRLNMLASREWQIAEFFTGLGLKKKGQPLNIDFPKTIGMQGLCKVGSHPDKKNNIYNDIKKIYSAENIAKKTAESQGFTTPQPAMVPGRF